MPAAGGPRRLAAGMVGPVPAARGRVVYLVLADKYFRPLASRLSGVNQPVISSQIRFSASR